MLNNKNSSLAQLLSVLKSAKHCLNICMYSLSFGPIINLCQELRQNNGIVIRIITGLKSEPTVDLKQCLHKTNDKTKRFKKFLQIGIETKLVKLEEGLMHNKFAIIDDNLLINGSLNWSENAIYHSFNDVLITREPKLVISYLDYFNKLWFNY